MIDILIADDHAIVREGLKQIVNQQIDIQVTGEAANANELLQKLKHDHWDVIILDINMPGQNGLEVLKEIHTLYPRLPVLILSIYDEEQYGLRSIKAGAAGYLKKVSAPEELVHAIQTVYKGNKYISASLAEKLADSIHLNQNGPPHEKLSDREYEILCLIASGKSAEQIAGQFSISVHTYYSYRNRIMEKMQLKSNVELTQYAIQNGLIDL
ncbi:MAG: response regulator [Caldithrix sp.]|nr:response regulator [Caldithrix sp.]